MQVNGQEACIKEGILLSDFLEQAGYVRERVAVERNGEIVPRDAYKRTVLKESDVLEIVQFVGGG